jgi:hypothetical protein
MALVSQPPQLKQFTSPFTVIVKPNSQWKQNTRSDKFPLLGSSCKIYWFCGQEELHKTIQVASLHSSVKENYMAIMKASE